MFGGTPDSFHLAAEYGPASAGNIPTPEALTPLEFEWTSAEGETQVGVHPCKRQQEAGNKLTNCWP